MTNVSSAETAPIGSTLISLAPSEPDLAVTQNPVRAALTHLLFNDTFFAFILRNFHIAETKSIPTMGVMFKKDRFFLHYNPEWIGKMTIVELAEILKHEALHIVFMHLSLNTPKEERARRNITDDLAINSFLNKEIVVKYKGMYPGVLNTNQIDASTGLPHPPSELQKAIAALPMLKSSDFYFAELQDVKDDNQNYQFDVHGGAEGDQPTDEEKEMATVLSLQLMKRAKEECDTFKSGWGNLHANLRELIDRIIDKQVDWKSLLRMFAMSLRSNRYNSTYRKVNRRMPDGIYPGIRRDYTPNIIIALDQSGSVSNEMLAKFFGALINLQNRMTFHILPFDTEVGELYTWKQGGATPELVRNMAGGTDFNAPTRWFNDNAGKYDGIIFLTDGECSPPELSKKRRMWILPEGQKLSFETDELVTVMR